MQFSNRDNGQICVKICNSCFYMTIEMLNIFRIIIRPHSKIIKVNCLHFKIIWRPSNIFRFWILQKKKIKLHFCLFKFSPICFCISMQFTFQWFGQHIYYLERQYTFKEGDEGKIKHQIFTRLLHISIYFLDN